MIASGFIAMEKCSAHGSSQRAAAFVEHGVTLERRNTDMLLIDAHLDLAWNALGWNRDLCHEVSAIRDAESDMTGKGRGCNTVSLPELRKAGVGISVVTVLARANAAGKNSIDFRNQDIAAATALGQLAYYRLLERHGLCTMIEDLPALEHAYATWQTEPETAPFGFILSMEGADPIVDPGHAEAWYRQGLRLVGLAHYGPSAYAYGTGSEGGLTPAGHDLLRVMEELGILLDLTHLADEAFWQALDKYRGPVLASHNNCRSITPHQRQFSDDQIRAIIERGGVIGAAFDAWMMVPGWTEDRNGRSPVLIENAVDHIDHICQIAGNASHVAVGSDLDGGFGTEQSPDDMNTIADLQRLAPILAARGYSTSDIEGIFHANWMNFFRCSWKR
jgi:membrane dipeptidase